MHLQKLIRSNKLFFYSYDDLEKNYKIEYIAGGSVQNTLRCTSVINLFIFCLLLFEAQWSIIELNVHDHF